MCRRLLFRAPEMNRWAKPLIVHEVAEQCGALCWGFCARICVFMVARRPRGGPTSSSSSGSRSSRRRRQGRELLSPGVAGLHPSPLYACVRTRNPLVSLTPSHRRKRKKIAVGLLAAAAAALIPLFLTLRGFCDGDELLNPTLVRPLRPHRRGAHHP